MFKLTPNSDGTWSESVLYAFKRGKDGAHPTGAVTFDAAGSLYGTAYWGANSNCSPYGCGVVFKLTPKGDGSWKESVLHTFTGVKDEPFRLAG